MFDYFLSALFVVLSHAVAMYKVEINMEYLELRFLASKKIKFLNVIKKVPYLSLNLYKSRENLNSVQHF